MFADSFGKLVPNVFDFGSTGLDTAVGQLLSGETLPLGHVRQPNLSFLGHIWEVVGEVLLDDRELATQLFDRLDFARVDRGFDLFHDFAHDFVAAFAERSQVAFLELDPNAFALVEHSSQLCVQSRAYGLVFEEVDRLLFVFFVQVFDDHRVARHFVGQCIRDQFILQVCRSFDQSFIFIHRNLLE